MNRRIFCLLAALPLLVTSAAVAREKRPNVLIITVDDMSADSLGAFGCKLKGTSPSIDAFAKQSLRFKHAHVQVGNCMPGRNIMWSGMFSHANGVEGFVQNKEADYPVLCDLAKDAGYFAAIRGKVSHSTPYHPYDWDAVLDSDSQGKKLHTKDAKGYGFSTRRGIELAKEAGKPFCLMVNISDPHKPFYAQGKGGDTIEDKHVPSHVFHGDDVPVPGFLPDDEVIRKELAHYYSSVRRADDCFQAIMKALDESGEADDTFVLFLSDHGMPLPFAKTQLYHHSTRTPLMVRWPTVTRAGAIDEKHMVSAVDLLPTLLDVMGHKHPDEEMLHGRSFAPILEGKSQSGRDFVILQYNENSGRNRHPMRGIQTREYLYLYNAWADGNRKFATATTGTMTYRQMVKRSEAEPDIAARLRLFDHRVPQELFRVTEDPDCLENLINHSDHRSPLESLRGQLAKSLAEMNDPVAPLLVDVEDVALREKYMAAEDERSERARAERARQRQKQDAKGAGNRPSNRGNLRNAIRLAVPPTVTPGKVCRVSIRHRIPANLGEQKVHVTLKRIADGSGDATREQRVERKVVTVGGDGEFEVQFEVPESLSGKVKLAAFIGEEFSSSLQHVQSKPIDVK